MCKKYLLPMLALGGVGFAVYAVVASARVMPSAGGAGGVAPATGPYATQVAGSGIVEANTENISIGTLVSGVVVEVPVKVNQDVRKGEVLFRLDDRDLAAQRAVQEAAVLSAQKKLEKLIAAPRAEDLPPAEAKVAEADAALADAKSQWERADAMKDTRAISEEELVHRKYAVAMADANLAAAKTTLAELKAGTWAPDLEIARADVASAKAALAATEINLDRLVVRAPIDGKVLQVNVRVGEYAQAGSLATPLMLMGNVQPLYVRVDVDENDAWRVEGRPDAEGVVRGKPASAGARARMKFVRVEPYVLPKKSLTGDTSERVDTRVLQVIYSLEAGGPAVYVGQQMDVFIAAR
jgi:multidrug resistance efflux pump